MFCYISRLSLQHTSTATKEYPLAERIKTVDLVLIRIQFNSQNHWMNDLQSTFLIFSASRRWLSLVRKVWENSRLLLLETQSNLYKMARYKAVTRCVVVTRQLPPNFQLHYIFCKVDLYISVTLYITDTLPFPKGDHCTQVWLYHLFSRNCWTVGCLKCDCAIPQYWFRLLLILYQ